VKRLSSDASLTTSSSPPRIQPVDATRANLLSTPPSRPRNHDPGDVTPGGWSTAATPGTPGVPNVSVFDGDMAANDGQTESLGQAGRPWDNGEMEGQDPNNPAQPAPTLFPPKKSVTFAPSTTSDESSSTPPPPTLSFEPTKNRDATSPNLQQNVDELSPGLVPRHIRPFVHPDPPGQTISPFSLSPHLLPQGGTPPILPSASTHYPHSNLSVSSPPPPVQISTKHVELTPALVAKAQKHCRFAISALDYEDAEHAKKELKEALALLGG
jgi:vacuolar protein sorting-associated protein VTA1